MSSIIHQTRKRVEHAVAEIRPEWLKPSSIHFCVTWRCNLNCRQCDIPLTGKKERPELTTEQICTAIQQLKDWLGPFHLNLAGGEPFIRKDIMDIIEFSSRNSITVGVTTNGMLITEKIAKRIERSGIQSLNISLDSMTPKMHDYYRNRTGSHKRIMKLIERLNKPRDYCLVIATILMSQNAEEVVEMVDWVENKMLNGIIFQPLFSTFGKPYQSGWWKGCEFWPRTKEQLRKLDSVLDELIKGKKDGSAVVNSVRQLEAMRQHFHHPEITGRRRCRADTKNFAINEYGDALLCFWLDPVGSVLEHSPKEIWHSALAKQRRNQIRHCRRNCSVLNCHFD